LKGWAEKKRPAAVNVKLIADSKDFSSDQLTLSFALLLCLSLPLIFVPLYLLIAPPPSFAIPKPAATALLIGAMFVIVFIGLFLKGRGILFKVPMRVFEEGIIIQPAMGIRPFLVPYADISAIEIWQGMDGKIRTGCSVSSVNSGTVRSVENFIDKNALKSFVDRIRPALEQNGFRAEGAQESGNSARFAFRRPLSLQGVQGWRI
jgi:hypothetical protein